MACLREIIRGVVFDINRTFVSGDIILPKVVGLSGKSKTLFGQKESFFPPTGTVFRRQASCAILDWCLLDDVTVRMPAYQTISGDISEGYPRVSRMDGWWLGTNTISKIKYGRQIKI